MNVSRAALRRDLRTRRGSLPDKKRAVLDAAIRRHFLKLVNSRGIGSVACYWPFDGEPDLIPACRQLIDDGCDIALPVLSGDDCNAMQFHSWDPGSSLARNRYGILEPRNSAPVSLNNFDMLIMPLVGYDRLGNRLGMGGGYYDRHLESLRDSAAPLRAGVAYSLQECDLIEKNDWDIPLHGIVNEHGWFTFVQ